MKILKQKKSKKQTAILPEPPETKALRDEDMPELLARAQNLNSLMEQRNSLQGQIGSVATTINLLSKAFEEAADNHAKRAIDALVNGHQLELQTLKERETRLHHICDVLALAFSAFLGKQYDLVDGEPWNLDLDKKILVRVVEPAVATKPQLSLVETPQEEQEASEHAE